MMTFVRTIPFPKCRHCGRTMEYWVPGQPDEEAAHPECEGSALAQELLARFTQRINEQVNESL